MPNEKEENNPPVFGKTKILAKKRILLPPPLPFERGEGLTYYFTTKGNARCEASFKQQSVEENGMVEFISDYTFCFKLLNDPHAFTYDGDVVATINAISKDARKQSNFINGIYYPNYMDNYTDDESKIEVWEEWNTKDGVPYSRNFDSDMSMFLNCDDSE